MLYLTKLFKFLIRLELHEKEVPIPTTNPIIEVSEIQPILFWNI